MPKHNKLNVIALVFLIFFAVGVFGFGTDINNYQNWYKPFPTFDKLGGYLITLRINGVWVGFISGLILVYSWREFCRRFTNKPNRFLYYMILVNWPGIFLLTNTTRQGLALAFLCLAFCYRVKLGWLATVLLCLLFAHKSGVALIAVFVLVWMLQKATDDLWYVFIFLVAALASLAFAFPTFSELHVDYGVTGYDLRPLLFILNFGLCFMMPLLNRTAICHPDQQILRFAQLLFVVCILLIDRSTLFERLGGIVLIFNSFLLLKWHPKIGTLFVLANATLAIPYMIMASEHISYWN